MAGRAKENLDGGSLKYLFVYLKVRIFKCSYHIYIGNYAIHSWMVMGSRGGSKFDATPRMFFLNFGDAIIPEWVYGNV